MRNIEEIKKALVSYAFMACQPNRGDVFGWIDDHAGEIAEAVLGASEIPLLLEMIKAEREIQTKILKERDHWFRLLPPGTAAAHPFTHAAIEATNRRKSCG